MSEFDADAYMRQPGVQASKEEFFESVEEEEREKTDLVSVTCPEGHKFKVSEYVLSRFIYHGCDKCWKHYAREELEKESK